MAIFSDQEIQKIRSVYQKLGAGFPQDKFIDIIRMFLDWSEQSSTGFVEALGPEMHLYQEMDSLERVEIILCFEKCLNIEIDDVKVGLIIRFGDLIQIANELYKRG